MPIREYQFCMVQKALFSNTLVCLPTGMGKTLIAAVVMFNFYRSGCVGRCGSCSPWWWWSLLLADAAPAGSVHGSSHLAIPRVRLPVWGHVGGVRACVGVWSSALWLAPQMSWEALTIRSDQVKWRHWHPTFNQHPLAQPASTLCLNQHPFGLHNQQATFGSTNTRTSLTITHWPGKDML